MEMECFAPLHVQILNLRLVHARRRRTRARDGRWNSPLCQTSRTLCCLRMEDGVGDWLCDELFAFEEHSVKVVGVMSPTCASPEMGHGLTIISKSSDAVFLRVKSMFFVHGAVSVFR
jgi:hypothetical protein